MVRNEYRQKVQRKPKLHVLTFRLVERRISLIQQSAPPADYGLTKPYSGPGVQQPLHRSIPFTLNK